jgi:copper transport protein
VRAPTWLAGVVVAVGLLLTAAPPALADGALLSAQPAPGARLATPPDLVRIVLPTRVESAFLRLEVRDASGRVVSGPAGRDPRDLRAVSAAVSAPGRAVLTVTWRVLSEDGHPAGGSYHVGVRADPGEAGSPSPVRSDHGPLPLAARFLALVGPLGLLGLVVLAAGVVAPAVRAAGIAVPGEGAAAAERFRVRAREALAARAGAWWAAWSALLVAWAVGVALLPLAVLRGLRAGPDDLGTLLGDTRFGVSWRVQAAGLVIAAVASVLARRRLAGRPPEDGAAAALLGAGPLLGLAAISWGGHASAGGDAGPNIVIDLLHSAATAAWIGGLLGLAVLVVPAAARLADADRTRFAAAVVVRFSALAMSAVAVLVVTGVYRTLAEVPVGDLLDTGYGRALLVKLGLFALLLVGGAYNRMVVHPRLERAALGLDPSDRGAATALRVSVRAELALAAALLVSVAVLVSLAPPA